MSAEYSKKLSQKSRLPSTSGPAKVAAFFFSAGQSSSTVEDVRAKISDKRKGKQRAYNEPAVASSSAADAAEERRIEKEREAAAERKRIEATGPEEQGYGEELPAYTGHDAPKYEEEYYGARQ